MPRLPRRRPATPRRLRVARPELLTVVVVATLLAGGCTGADEEPAADATPSAGERPLAEYDATGLTLTRTSPCPDLPEEAVTAALGGEVTDASAYEDGDRAPLAPGLTDVAHEAGCVLRGQDGAAARAWVFTPAVTPERAESIARQLRRERGCRQWGDAPAFGEPGVGRTCQRGKRVVGSYGGLFGDAWLGCSVAMPGSAVEGGKGATALAQRTGAWCVAVLETARQASE